MFDLLFSAAKTPLALVTGRDVAGVTGTAASSRDPHDLDPGYFAIDTTIIVGSREAPAEAVWRITLDRKPASDVSVCMLLIAARRPHAGLHSKIFGAEAKVFFNNRARDTIRLKDIPDGHSDYFHRPQLPKLPDMWPFSGCGTVYAWMCTPEEFRRGPNSVRIQTSAGVFWDIDYIGLAVESPDRILREPYKTIGAGLIGAILGALATKIIG